MMPTVMGEITGRELAVKPYHDVHLEMEIASVKNPCFDCIVLVQSFLASIVDSMTNSLQLGIPLVNRHVCFFFFKDSDGVFHQRAAGQECRQKSQGLDGKGNTQKVYRTFYLAQKHELGRR